MGYNTNIAGSRAVGIGANSTAGGLNGLSLGYNADSTGANTIVVGADSDAGAYTDAILIGEGLTGTANNELNIGDTIKGDISTGAINLESQAVGSVPLTITGETSQTANLLEIEDDSSTTLMSVSPEGYVEVPLSSNNSTPVLRRIDAPDQGIVMTGTTGNRDTRIYSDSFSYAFTKLGMINYAGQGTYKCNGFGSSSATILGHRSDADTGVYFGGADDVRLSAGGVDSFIGTTTYSSVAKIFGVGQYATGSLPTASSYEGYLAYDTTTDEVKFSDGSAWTALGGGGTEDITFTSSIASTIPLTLQGSTSQTGNLLDFENDSATVLSAVLSDGTISPRIGSSQTDAGIMALGESNLGIAFYQTGSNGQTHILAGSTARYDFTKNGLTSYSADTQPHFKAGSRGANTIPMFSFSNDKDTGFYSEGADDVSFTAGGVQGIGQTSTKGYSALPFELASYATGSLPTASSFEGSIVYDSTTQTIKWSDGTSWATI
ncbi:MAG: hypothetical protein CL529_12680 [Aequorivita sp.]|nr:hypothetical protein [Aequorivita sp.]